MSASSFSSVQCDRLFCRSLRTNPEWVAIVPKLLATPTGWNERLLETHDLEARLRSPTGWERTYRFLLFSSRDSLVDEAIQQRVEKVTNLGDGKAIVIFFPGSPIGDDRPIDVFMKFQIDLMSKCDVPILAVNTAADLRPTIESFLREASVRHPQPPAKEALRTAFSQFVKGKHLPVLQVNRLMRLAPSVEDLIKMAHSKEGHKAIVDALGSRDGERVIAFVRMDQNLD